MTKHNACPNLLEPMPLVLEVNLRSTDGGVPIPFRYYVFAYKILLLGQEQPGNVTYCPVPSEVASTLLSLIKIKLEESPNVILPVMEELMPAAEYVAANQELLKANKDIFGSFAEKVDEIKRLYAESQAAAAMPPDLFES
jgi:hypothetical protein